MRLRQKSVSISTFSLGVFTDLADQCRSGSKPIPQRNIPVVLVVLSALGNHLDAHGRAPTRAGWYIGRHGDVKEIGGDVLQAPLRTNQACSKGMVDDGIWTADTMIRARGNRIQRRLEGRVTKQRQERGGLDLVISKWGGLASPQGGSPPSALIFRVKKKELLERASDLLQPLRFEEICIDTRSGP